MSVTVQSGIVIGREKLTAARTYYVRKDGSDSNAGLADTAGGGFLTIQKAVNTVAGLDMYGQTVTIQVRVGTYSENVVLVNVPGFAVVGNLVIQGDTSDDDSIIVSGTTSAFSADGTSSVWSLRYMKVTSSSSSVGAIRALNGGDIRIDNIVFGTASRAHMETVSAGRITASAGYAVDGAAPRHWQCVGAGSTMAMNGRTVQFRATMAFSTAFAVAQNTAFIAAFSMTFDTATFAATITGTRDSISGNAVVNTAGGGASYLPGNVSGTPTTGGQYL